MASWNIGFSNLFKTKINEGKRVREKGEKYWLINDSNVYVILM